MYQPPVVGTYASFVALKLTGDFVIRMKLDHAVECFWLLNSIGIVVPPLALCPTIFAEQEVSIFYTSFLGMAV